MPTKRDPLAAVIQYFTTAPNDELARTLLVVKEIVRSRQPLHTKKATTPRRPVASLAPAGGGPAHD